MRPWWLVCVLVACVAPTRPVPAPRPAPRAERSGKPAFERPNHPLSQAEARGWALTLLNRDRVSMGLGPLVLDEVASAAAARHVSDMIARGFTAHWGSDGSIPELRYSDLGGQDLVVENVACFGDGKPRTPSDEGPFDPEAIEQAERRFFEETAPDDGHRKNILLPLHTRAGFAFGLGSGSAMLCVAQELVHHEGSYAPLPKTVRAGDLLHVEGDLDAPFGFGAVGIAWLPTPGPMTFAALHATGSYTMPEPHLLFQTAEFETPKPVTVVGRHFVIDLPLDSATRNAKTEGLFEILIYAHAPKAGARIDPVSARVVRLEP